MAAARIGLAGRQALGPFQLDGRGRQPVADGVVHFPRQPVALFDHRQRLNLGGVLLELAVLGLQLGQQQRVLALGSGAPGSGHW